MAALLEDPKLTIVLDVKVQLTVRLGSCQLAMRDVLELNPGTIIQLDQRANDPIGLYVNDKLVARGEVVVLEENFGIKVTELIGDQP
jgi:flagellar motor switch protein FliN